MREKDKEKREKEERSGEKRTFVDRSINSIRYHVCCSFLHNYNEYPFDCSFSST
jgi:hypothetical protein